ncbi:MAG: integral rane sensor signal transduction histidine kinase [Herbinix sp.]|jgi:two-component system sensor histidine kinase YesM|nr:integral rane sensor signal transduction histidine kinase [Herbinix sp.]
MKHDKPLAQRCANLIFTLFIIAGFEAIALVYSRNITWEPLIRYWYLVWVIILAIIICLLASGYYYIIIPFRRIQKILRLFNQGQTNEQLFQMKDTFCKELPITMNRISDMLDKQTAIKMSKKQAEYLALQNQISPHFLYNTLEAIRGDALDVGMYNIAETTEALATFFRYTITEVENLVTLEDELENVENYFIIQRYRFGEKLNMEIRTGEDIGVLQSQLPKLTLQPIIENAVFHGLECKRGEGTIRINVETTKAKLLISIVDDGVGIEENQLEKINQRLNHIEVNYMNDDKEERRGGIALSNVSSRIKLLFGEEYGLHIYSNKNIGTNVRITLPLLVEEK